jgi:sugar phosphate permease
MVVLDVSIVNVALPSIETDLGFSPEDLQWVVSGYSLTFGGFLLIGIGLGFSFVPVSIAALAGVPQEQAGLASGLINTSQQIGGALGVAILTTVSTTTTSDAIASGTDRPQALVDGFSVAFWVAAAFAAGAIVATLLALRRQDLAGVEPAHAPAGV